MTNKRKFKLKKWFIKVDRKKFKNVVSNELNLFALVSMELVYFSTDDRHGPKCSVLIRQTDR